MELDKNNPQGRGLQFFASDPYFIKGTQLINKASGTLLTAGHAGIMYPLGVTYDATRRVVAAPVQLVGLVASLLPSKKNVEVSEDGDAKVEVVDAGEATDAVEAEVVEPEEKIVPKTVKKATKKTKQVVKDLSDLGKLIPGAA